MAGMTRIGVVKMFFEKDSTKVEATDMMAFWKACNEEERKEYAESAAKQLGVELAASL